ncbi:TetR/AcrR family transcriptional regulator [Enterococcus faecium]|uniref:TetR/AcrR family transcriptional regulator n=1 Tax=Enterococcus TaxID=1350 RepID=UPI0003FE2699|nr:TetR/AcrR family transcriptional regulator [Enterococcus faecium]EGP4810776.1 TetR/AcrR family transcriptional regulator [Enterococcus faecium]EGP5109066.1 TetR/AcrR family transcriptional regulator [Enterococcus faecium]EGP5363384.1 TetR/AcrR family transcriptional regulator [Enterococcus faecium]EGP5479604.1 TetR/AcrR family transcriptional regulator [Enterococcus faecium]EGP5638011.1 TetR/AcrR family transcriptional regulator [Enterococcus faecium]
MKTKEKILEATKDLIYKKGYHETSIRDILAASDTGKGQFYYYFSSKKEVCLAVIHAHMDVWQTELFEDILNAGKQPEEALEEMLDWIFADHEAQITYHGCPVGNLIIELSTVDEEFRLLLLELVNQWVKYTKQNILALSEEKLSDAEADRQAKALIAEIQGSILLLKVTQDLSLLRQNFQLIKERLSTSQKVL